MCFKYADCWQINCNNCLYLQCWQIKCSFWKILRLALCNMEWKGSGLMCLLSLSPQTVVYDIIYILSSQLCCSYTLLFIVNKYVRCAPPKPFEIHNCPFRTFIFVGHARDRDPEIDHTVGDLDPGTDAVDLVDTNHATRYPTINKQQHQCKNTQLYC